MNVCSAEMPTTPRPTTTVPVPLAHDARLIALVSTTLLATLILMRAFTGISVGPVGNVERIFVVIFIGWAILATLVRGRIRIPKPMALILVPGIVMVAVHHAFDPAFVIFPLLILAVVNIPFSFRIIGNAAFTLTVVTAGVTITAVMAGVDLRPGKWTNLTGVGGLPSLWHELFSSANQPAQTALLCLPLMVMARQRGDMSRPSLAIGLVLAVATMVATDSRSTLVGGLVFMSIIWLDIPKSLGNPSQMMIRALSLLLLLAVVLTAMLGSDRWVSLERIANETVVLIADDIPDRPPMARSIITAASVSVAMEHPLIGVGPNPNAATNAWSEARGLFVHTRYNVKPGALHQGGTNVHGAIAMLVLRTGAPSAAAMLYGFFLFWIAMLRRGHIRCAILFGSALAMLLAAQFGMDHLGKAYCWLMLAILIAHELRPPRPNCQQPIRLISASVTPTTNLSK